MFDFDAGKLLVIGIVALIVIGPKELPGVLRQVGQTVAKLRRMAADFQTQFMDAIKDAELEGLKDDLASIRDATTFDTVFDPVRDVHNEIVGALADPPTDAVAEPPQFDMAGLPEIADAQGPNFIETGVAPVALEPPQRAEPIVEPAPSPPAPLRLDDEAEPEPVRKVGGI